MYIAFNSIATKLVLNTTSSTHIICVMITTTPVQGWNQIKGIDPIDDLLTHWNRLADPENDPDVTQII